MPTENLPLIFILWFCAGIFLAIGAWAVRRRDPMHFWSGIKVAPEEIRDIPAYNRACAWMWRGYALLFILAGAAGFYKASLAGILTALAGVVGTPLLILIYRHIYNTYKA